MVRSPSMSPSPSIPSQSVQLLDERAFPLRNRRVLLGVTGGIAAYKAAEITRLLVLAGAKVRVVMTQAACQFVTPLTFQTLSANPVAVDMFEAARASEINHLALAEQADLFVIAPATADAIARLAAGMANDLLTATALATRAPTLLAPAMNTRMWENPLVQQNVRRLVELGIVKVIGPAEGELACGVIGAGRMAEPADVVEEAGQILTEKDMTGRRLLVTAGPTREAIDPVRYVSNRSSGRMGYALAKAAAARGAMVSLVSGPTTLRSPRGVELLQVATAAEMHDITTIRAARADAIVMAAAIADYRPVEISVAKLKKEDLGDRPQLDLSRNPDILAELGKDRRQRGGCRPILVGFAAETELLEARARGKLEVKGCDLIVANNVGETGSGFDVETNRVTLIGSNGTAQPLPLATKDEVAHQVLDRVRMLLEHAP
ncbi:MAG: bifunctional phosphopantothenoylcysteine decarboxylase/phosphopantothenate--cysteine ligase CoaBC [Pseudomonadota bacterium]